MSAVGTRAARVGGGVAVACLAYTSSLILQRRFPQIGDLLAVDLGEGARPTYYLRTLVSLGLGLLHGALLPPPRRWVGPGRESVAAAEAGLLVLLAVALAALFP